MRLLGYLLLSLGTILATVAVAPVPELEATLEAELQDLADSALAGIPEARERFPWLADRPEDLGRELLADLETLAALAARPAAGGSPARVAEAMARAEKILRPLLEAGPGDGGPAAAQVWREEVEKQAAVVVRRIQAAWPDFPEAGRFAAIQRLGRGLDTRRRRLREALGTLGPAAEPWLARLDVLDERIDARLGAVAAPLENPAWGIFAVSVGLMVVGIVVARRAGASGPAAAAVAGSAGGARLALERLVEGTRRLAGRVEELDDPGLHEALDALQKGPVFDFLENREELQRSLGLGRYAEVMAQLAIGERLLNRAWTALADGYGAEARRSLQEALPFLEDAMRLAAPAGPGG